MSYRSIYTGQQVDLMLASISTKLSAADLATINANIASIQTSIAALQAVTNNNYLVANLPTTAANGQIAFATNGRKVGELAGAGTGVPVYFNGGKWRVFSTDAQVQV